MSEIASRYDASQVEDKWYEYWMDKNYFHSEPDDREAFSIVIPPPNVTGMLHMGHMLNNTIQDVLIRKARLDGKNACWVPGTDHASIATEAKVVKMLREDGIKKSDLTREEFLTHAWAWKEKYGGIILQQLKKLGASCDWERTAFTMDEPRSEAVIKVFVDLYNKGKLYRGLRMVNWDPEAKTVLSNEEVLHKEEHGKLHFLNYRIVGEEGHVTIATTRPETILGDTAVAVNPKDERYTHLQGKKVIVPLINREVPVIFDSYVEMDFGTGALKVTPAHDINDYEIGKRHDLEVIDIFNDDATVSEAGQLYIGKKRFKVRTEIVKELEEKGFVKEIKDYPHSVGRSERTNAVVEPKLSLQWYVDMKQITKPALEAVMTDDIQFFPDKFKNSYRNWMENMQDWCISRQLWWGHRIPAWYLGEEVFIAETAEEALTLAIKKTGNEALTIADLKQDEDVLDTWFSSWLWPITCFGGFKESEDFKYYFPTSVLVTGWDILPLWVARMIMSGFEWQEERPFKDVYFHGMVRDQKRRKMSKSLGNSPEALKLIKDFGADGVRYGMLSCSPKGGDLLFDDKHCENGRNFANKIWNALRLIKSFKVDDSTVQSDENKLAVSWINNKLDQIIGTTNKDYLDYRLSEVVKQLYSFIWTDFCSWYLEMIKPAKGESIDEATLNQTIEVFEKMTKMLHPFMPFITEEIWHQLKIRGEGEDCIISTYPQAVASDVALVSNVEKLKDVVAKIRDIRNSNGIKMQKGLEVKVESDESAQALYKLAGAKGIVEKMANLSSLEFVASEQEVEGGNISFLSGNEKYFALVEITVDVEAEKERITKELEYAKGFATSIEKKLSNERFVSNAPEAVVAKEKEKLADGIERIRILEESLASL